MTTKLSAKRKKFDAVMESLNFLLQQKDERLDRIDKENNITQVRNYWYDRKKLTQSLQDALCDEFTIAVDRRTIYSMFDFLEGKSYIKRVVYPDEIVRMPDNDTVYELNYFKIKQAVSSQQTLKTDCTPPLLNSVKPDGGMAQEELTVKTTGLVDCSDSASLNAV